MTKDEVIDDAKLLNTIDNILLNLKDIEGKDNYRYDANNQKVYEKSRIDEEDQGYIEEYKVNLIKFLVNHLKGRNEQRKRNQPKRRSRNR